MGALAVARSPSPFSYPSLEYCQGFPSQVKDTAVVHWQELQHLPKLRHFHTTSNTLLLSSASLLFHAKHQLCSFCSRHAWILSGKEKSLSLGPILPKEVFPCPAKPLEMGWQRRTGCPGSSWTGSSVWPTVNWVPSGACFRSEENQLLTQHHSRWAQVCPIGGQHLQGQLLQFKSLSHWAERTFPEAKSTSAAMPGSPCPPPSAKNTLPWWWLYADEMVQNGTASPLHCNLPPQVGTGLADGCGLYLYKQMIISNKNPLSIKIHYLFLILNLFKQLHSCTNITSVASTADPEMKSKYMLPNVWNLEKIQINKE